MLTIQASYPLICGYCISTQYQMNKYIVVRNLDPREGQVTLVQRKRDGELFVRKRVMRFMDAEAKVLSRLRHPHIISLVEAFEDGEYLMLILEYASGGDLRDVMSRRKGERFTEGEVLACFVALASAVKYLHDHHVAHRDIKPDNIFLTGEGAVKLGDFGLSAVLRDEEGDRSISAPRPRSTTTMRTNVRAGTPGGRLRPSTGLARMHDADTKNNTAKKETSCLYVITPEERSVLDEDLVALGRTLYELVVLNQAYRASDGGGLVLDYRPLPATMGYSAALRQLVATMLQSYDATSPIQLWRILNESFLQSFRCGEGAISMKAAATLPPLKSLRVDPTTPAASPRKDKASHAVPSAPPSPHSAGSGGGPSAPPAEKCVAAAEEEERRREREAATARLLLLLRTPPPTRHALDLLKCVREGADIMAQGEDMRRPALHTVLWQGDVTTFGILLQTSQPIDFTATDRDGFTPLHLLPCGSQKGNAVALQLLQLLLHRLRENSGKDQVDWGQRDRWGRTFHVFVTRWNRQGEFFPVLESEVEFFSGRKKT